MPRPRRSDDEDAVPVMVPRNERALVPVTPARARKLRRHLVNMLRQARGLTEMPSRSPSEPTGFAARVAQAACSLCKGWCCKGGGDDAYLDDETIARVRNARPELDVRGLLRLYADLVPALAHERSCIFHASKGCTLDRSLRANICNSYFCGGLAAFLSDGDPAAPRVILAGEGNAMRTSAVLAPRSGRQSNSSTGL
jgi:hypothetical protein